MRPPRAPLKRVLITGASGFIGHKLVLTLVERGIDVVALARTPSSRSQSWVEHRTADVTDARSMRGMMDGCDTVIHLAGLAHKIAYSLSDADFDRVNVGGTQNVLEEAARSGAVRFIFLSSAGVGGSFSTRPLTEDEVPKPGDPYARSKVRAEQVVRSNVKNDHLWTAILRPPMVYGPGDPGNLPRLASVIRKGVPLPFGAVSNARSVVFVGNLVHAIMLLLEREPGNGDIFYVADDTPLSTADLAREIGSALGTPARIIPVPKRVLTSLARAGDLIAKARGFPFTSRELNKLTGTLVVDDSKLRRASGYKPLVTTPAGIRATFSSESRVAGAASGNARQR